MQAVRGRHIVLGIATALAFLLTACGATPGAVSTTPNGGDVILSVGQATVVPTPLFPQYTVGAWVSDPSPNLHDNITVYAVARQNPADMLTPPKAVVGAQVHFVIIGGKDQMVTTDGSGIAAWPTTAEGTPTQPTQIEVILLVSNQTLATSYTFYTILPTAYPFPTQGPVAPTATPHP